MSVKAPTIVRIQVELQEKVAEASRIKGLRTGHFVNSVLRMYFTEPESLYEESVQIKKTFGSERSFSEVSENETDDQTDDDFSQFPGME